MFTCSTDTTKVNSHVIIELSFGSNLPELKLLVGITLQKSCILLKKIIRKFKINEKWRNQNKRH